MATCTDVRPATEEVGCPGAPVRPAAVGDRVRPGTRALLAAFTVLTALATNQLLVLGGHTDRYWPWTIKIPATAGFLGAAYAAGFLLSVLSLRQRSWARVRIAVATVTVFAFLTLVATVVHAHRLHLSAADPLARGAAWFWVAVYVAVPLAGLTMLARQEQGRGGRGVVRRPLPAG